MWLSSQLHQSMLFTMFIQKFHGKMKKLKLSYKIRILFNQKFQKILLFSIFLVVLSCILLDSTGFLFHFFIYIIMIYATIFVHENIIVWLKQKRSVRQFVRKNSHLVLSLVWLLVSIFFPFPPGPIRVFMTSGTIIAIGRFVFSCFGPEAILVAISFTNITIIGLYYGLGIELIIGSIFFFGINAIACLRFLWHDLTEKASLLLIHGVLLATTMLLAVSFFSGWIFLSIKSFWINSSEISKFDVLH